jgi:hypothetical protein
LAEGRRITNEFLVVCSKLLTLVARL